MAALLLNGVTIDTTFAEAFPMKATRLVITAPTRNTIPARNSTPAPAPVSNSQ